MRGIVPGMPSNGPLLVFGPRSTTYDFGPGHPLTPRRFGPGIDLLQSVGAEPSRAPEPATDEELLRVHLPPYVDAVRRFSADPALRGAMGIGLADNPAFPGMHEAAASVAGGSLAGMEAILNGETLHALHPGGGLHHAMPAKAWGFCVYNDAALAVVHARAQGLRVLYVDLDVHHGDGVQAMTYRDPGTLTLSLHESGRYLFPGTGYADELGEGTAAGTSVNMPFEPYAGEAAWLPAVRALVPTLAAVFGPDIVVSQHGADSHAWDPLAHLRVTTAGMAEAARLVDAIAHRWADGRWLATGGGGYDAYRVVPRTWALTWLAGAHLDPPEHTPPAWRERWAAEAASFGTPGMPATFLDAPGVGRPVGDGGLSADVRSLEMLARVRAAVLPRLVLEAEDRGWWRPSLEWAGRPVAAGTAQLPGAGPATGVDTRGSDDPARPPDVRGLRPGDLAGLELLPRTIAPFDPADGRALLEAALRDGARVVGAVSAGRLVGVAVTASSRDQAATESLLAVGVAPAFRGGGIGRSLLAVLVAACPARTAMEARVGVGERDAVEPADIETRLEIGRRLLAGAGFELRAAPPDLARDDRWTLIARRPSA